MPGRTGTRSDDDRSPQLPSAGGVGSGRVFPTAAHVNAPGEGFVPIYKTKQEGLAKPHI